MTPIQEVLQKLRDCKIAHRARTVGQGDVPENPYLERYTEDVQDTLEFFRRRDECIHRYGFAVPNEEALEALVGLSPLVEIGAGGGYWAKMIEDRGGTVYPYDAKKGLLGGHPEGPIMPEEWVPVSYGDASSVEKHPGANLLLIWPPYEDPMAYDALRQFTGNYVAYVGEGWGGCTADDAFFELLKAEFEEPVYIDIPQWYGIRDYLSIYQRKNILTVGQIPYM